MTTKNEQCCPYTVIEVQGQPTLLLVDADAGIDLSHLHRLSSAQLAGTPILLKKPGTDVSVLDIDSLAYALLALPADRWEQVRLRMAAIKMQREGIS